MVKTPVDFSVRRGQTLGTMKMEIDFINRDRAPCHGRRCVIAGFVANLQNSVPALWRLKRSGWRRKEDNCQFPKDDFKWVWGATPTWTFKRAPIKGPGWLSTLTPGSRGATVSWVKKEPKLPGVIPTLNVFSGLNCDLPLLLTCLFIWIVRQSFKLSGAFTVLPREDARRLTSVRRLLGCKNLWHFFFMNTHNLLKIPDWSKLMSLWPSKHHFGLVSRAQMPEQQGICSKSAWPRILQALIWDLRE